MKILNLPSQFQNVPVRSSSRRSGNFNHRNTKRISRIEIFAQRRDRPKWGVLKLAHLIKPSAFRPISPVSFRYISYIGLKARLNMAISSGV